MKTAALHFLPPEAMRWEAPQRTQRAKRIQIHVSLFAISAFSVVKKSPLPFKNQQSSIVNQTLYFPCSGASATAALHHLPPEATRWDEPQRTQRAQRIQIHVSLFAIPAFSAAKKSPLPFKNPKSKIINRQSPPLLPM
jgi:hypothetical protein